MRHQVLTLAAVALLAVTACSPDTVETPTPGDVSTPAVETSNPGITPEATDSASSMDTLSPDVTTSDASPSPDDGSKTPKGPTTTSNPGDAGNTGEDVDLAEQTFAISPQQALDKALQEARGNGIVHSIELDWSRSNNTWVYEIDVLVGNTDHDIDINADTGEVLEHQQDDTNDTEKAINLASPMTWETARDRALGAAQGRITSWKLEWDDNYTSYQFDIEGASGDETEVEVNVDTGDVRIDD